MWIVLHASLNPTKIGKLQITSSQTNFSKSLAALSPTSPHKRMHGRSWTIPWPSLAGSRCKRHTLLPRKCETLWPHQLVLQLVLQQLQCLQLQLEDRLGEDVGRLFVQRVIQPTAGQIVRTCSRLSGTAHAARHHWEPGRCPGRVHSWQSKLPVQRAPLATRSIPNHRPSVPGREVQVTSSLSVHLQPYQSAHLCRAPSKLAQMPHLRLQLLCQAQGPHQFLWSREAPHLVQARQRQLRWER